MGHANPIESVCFSPDGRRIVSRAGQSNDFNEVHAWDAYTGALLPPGADRAPPSGVVLVARSPDGRLLAAARGEVLVVRRLDGPPPGRADRRPPAAADAYKLEGQYFCSGTNPGGAKYGGITVEIRTKGDNYHLIWTGNGANDEGEGTVVGSELVVTFKGPAGRGMVVYKVQDDGVLVGTWKFKGAGKECEETLKRK